MGSDVASRIPASSCTLPPSTSTASAPSSSARLAASGPPTSTMSEIPSPSEIAWLKRRAAVTTRDRSADEKRLVLAALPVDPEHGVEQGVLLPLVEHVRGVVGVEVVEARPRPDDVRRDARPLDRDPVAPAVPGSALRR